MSKQPNLIFYSTDCPRCKILQKKMDDAKLEYTKVTDVDALKDLSITKVPMLSIDGNMCGYADAVKYVNEIGGQNK